MNNKWEKKMLKRWYIVAVIIIAACMITLLICENRKSSRNDGYESETVTMEVVTEKLEKIRIIADYHETTSTETCDIITEVTKPIETEVITEPVPETAKPIETTINVTEKIVETKPIATEVDTEPVPETTSEITTAAQENSGRRYLGKFITTGYCSKCNGGWGTTTCTGGTITPGVTVAMNRNQIKDLGLHYGDHIYIDGIGERIIQDNGCNYNVIDIACNSSGHPYSEYKVSSNGIQSVSVYLLY